MNKLRHGTKNIRRERARAELRHLVFCVCCVGGTLFALPWALAYTVHPAKCTRGPSCVGDALMSGLLPVVLRAGVGTLIGTAVGILLCLAVPGLRRRSRARST